MTMSVYDELSLQDTEALSQVDDGADIVGKNCLQYSSHFLSTLVSAFI